MVLCPTLNHISPLIVRNTKQLVNWRRKLPWKGSESTTCIHQLFGVHLANSVNLEEMVVTILHLLKWLLFKCAHISNLEFPSKLKVTAVTAADVSRTRVGGGGAQEWRR